MYSPNQRGWKTSSRLLFSIIDLDNFMESVPETSDPQTSVSLKHQKYLFFTTLILFDEISSRKNVYWVNSSALIYDALVFCFALNE